MPLVGTLNVMKFHILIIFSTRKIMLSAFSNWNRPLLTGIALSTLVLLASLLMTNSNPSSLIPIDYPAAIIAQDNLESSTKKGLLPGKFRVRLQRNENLVSLFDRLLLGSGEITGMLNSLSTTERRRLSRLAVGTDIYISLTDSDRLQELIVMEGPIEGRRYYRKNSNKGGGFAVAKYQAEYRAKYKYNGGTITSSLYQDGINQGLSGRLILNFAEIFAFDIDFANDVRSGDSFAILLEDLYVENRSVKEDTIAVAEFINNKKSILAIRYANSAGEVGYFTPKGESMQSRFLRMPISLARISSRFNPKRLHPVLKIVRPHNGVDFAARRGTPVFTTGNGRASLVGNNGGYGKTVIIDHGDGYTTLYAHLRGFARGMRKGKVVKQGQVIGYVGTTGVSTGPHLHYEFRIRGRHRDPLKVQLARSINLDKKELPRFLAHSEILLAKYHKSRSDRDEVVSRGN